MKTKKICIVGGGSLGLVCAATFLSQGITVNVLTSRPNDWNHRIRVFDPDGKEYGGILSEITSDPYIALEGAEMVFLTLPGFAIAPILKRIKPFLRPTTILGSVVGSTGFFFIAHKILNSDQPLFAFQRVPFIARQRIYGEIGDLLGYKPQLNVAFDNIENQDKFIGELEELFNTPINLLDSYLEASLTNSNPILHTGRLYQMWNSYDGSVYPERSLFYGEWTDEASEILLKMDGEFQQLLVLLKIKDSIPSLLDYYGVADGSSLTEKIRSIPAFKTILSPMKEKDGGWVPDFQSRYFTEDFPYGLRWIRMLAKQQGLATPNIDRVYEWGMSMIDDGSA